MQLTPQYGRGPAVTFDGAIDDQREPLVRQRQRMADALATLTAAQWASPSRCEGWSVQDVVSHLIGTNEFWSLSIAQGLAGAPTEYLASFDPVATPPLMVEPMRSLQPSEVLDKFVATNEALFAIVNELDDDGWVTRAESPAGHVQIRLLAYHALWDGWIHERDVLLPLGIAPVEEADEVVSSLRYVAAVAPVFAFSVDAARTGALAIEASDPDAVVVVEVGDGVSVHGGPAPAGATVLRGPAAALVDMLTFRRPFDQEIPEDRRWLFDGLATVFDTAIEHV